MVDQKKEVEKVMELGREIQNLVILLVVDLNLEKMGKPEIN